LDFEIWWNLCFGLGSATFKLQFWILKFDEIYVLPWVLLYLNCNFGLWFFDQLLWFGCQSIKIAVVNRTLKINWNLQIIWIILCDTRNVLGRHVRYAFWQEILKVLWRPKHAQLARVLPNHMTSVTPAIRRKPLKGIMTRLYQIVARSMANNNTRQRSSRKWIYGVIRHRFTEPKIIFNSSYACSCIKLK
jgi:hypothetical protein